MPDHALRSLRRWIIGSTCLLTLGLTALAIDAQHDRQHNCELFQDKFEAYTQALVAAGRPEHQTPEQEAETQARVAVLRQTYADLDTDCR